MAITQLLLAARARLTDFTLGEGAVSELSVNQSGRLRVSSKGGLYANATGNLVNTSDVLTIDVSDAGTLLAHVKNTGTASMTGGGFIFEGSIDSTNGTDGTWFSILGSRTNANTAESSFSVASMPAGTAFAFGWKFSVSGINWFRVRCSTAVTAATIATWTATRAAFAMDPVPSVQTHAVTGSGTFTVSGTATTTPTGGTAAAFTSAASTNPFLVKNSAGNLMELSIANLTGATIYVKIHNSATAPTVGTTGVIMQYAVAAGVSQTTEYGAIGKRFNAGIALSVTGAAAATDATAIGAGALISATYI